MPEKPEFNPQPGEWVRHVDGGDKWLVAGTVFFGGYGECRILVNMKGVERETLILVLRMYYEYA